MTLSPTQLEAKVIASFGTATATVISPTRTKPIVASIDRGDAPPLTLRIFSWNITHGGATRNPNEFRIQMTGSRPDVQAGTQTIILGWSEQFEVFAAWDPALHVSRDSTSPSLQVPRSTLVSAYDNGLASEVRGSGDIVVAFKPSLLLGYSLSAADLHHEDPHAVNEDLHAIAADPQVPGSAMRTRATRQVSYWVRASDFADRVLAAYDGQCAVCGTQLRLVDAAHIVPVAYPDSTDETSNGIALCAIHHRAYDARLLQIDRDSILRVSSSVAANLRDSARSNGLDELQSFEGRPLLIVPALEGDRPRPDYLQRGFELRS